MPSWWVLRTKELGRGERSGHKNDAEQGRRTRKEPASDLNVLQAPIRASPNRAQDCHVDLKRRDRRRNKRVTPDQAPARRSPTVAHSGSGPTPPVGGAARTLLAPDPSPGVARSPTPGGAHAKIVGSNPPSGGHKKLPLMACACPHWVGGGLATAKDLQLTSCRLSRRVSGRRMAIVV